MAIRLRYTGGGYGGSINGVPARDLTDEDIREFRLDAATLIAGGLYQPVEESPVKAIGTEKMERPRYADKAVRGRRENKGGD